MKSQIFGYITVQQQSVFRQHSSTKDRNCSRRCCAPKYRLCTDTNSKRATLMQKKWYGRNDLCQQLLLNEIFNCLYVISLAFWVSMKGTKHANLTRVWWHKEKQCLHRFIGHGRGEKSKPEVSNSQSKGSAFSDVVYSMPANSAPTLLAVRGT